MPVTGALGNEIPLAVVGVALALLLASTGFLADKTSEGNNNCRLKPGQIIGLVLAVVVMLVAAAAIGYASREDFSQDCIHAYWLVMGILAVSDGLWIFINS